jgi:AraC-like DNA-binding protein
MNVKTVAACTVATVVEPAVRPRLDVVAQGRFRTYHAESVLEAVRAVRDRPVQAVFVSPSYVRRDELPRVASLVDNFPGIPTVALVSRHNPRASERLLELGNYGVRRIVDLSERDGWYYLRDLISHPTSPIAGRIFSKVMPAMGEPTQDCRVVFEALVRLAPEVTTVLELTKRFGVAPSTFMSRFFRAGLPSPKRYLAATRIVYAAAVFEVPGLSIADVAYRLQYSSPQSFGRHLRAVLGTTAGEFRIRYSFESSLDEFVRRLIAPFRSILRTFHPLDPGVGCLGQNW